MMRRVALVLLLAPVLAAPAFAGIFFNNTKKPDKPNPADRVPELIKIVQTDGDEDKRVAAAVELREYDPTQFPDIDAGADRRAAQRQEARRAGRGGPEPRQDPAGVRPGGHGPGAVAGQGFVDARPLAGPQRLAAIPLERLEGAGAEERRDADGPAEGPAAEPEQGAAAGARCAAAAQDDARPAPVRAASAVRAVPVTRPPYQPQPRRWVRSCCRWGRQCRGRPATGRR